MVISSWRKLRLSWAVGVLLVLSLGFKSVEGTMLVFDDCPETINASQSEMVYWTPPVVMANVGVVVTGEERPGRYYYKSTTVTYMAEADGEIIEPCTFEIVLIDNGSPVITSCPDDMTEMAFGKSQVAVSWSEPEVEDAGNVQATSDKSSGDQFGLGRNTVTYTFTDTNNADAAKSYCSFDVFVQESPSSSTPTINCPDDMSVMLTPSQDSMPVTWDDATYPSNLGSVTLICGRRKGDSFYEGRNEITCVAYFESGAARACTFVVTVAPTEDGENPSILDCPDNINMYVAKNVTGAVVTWTEPTITDNNQQDLQLVSSHTNGIFYVVGSYPVTYIGTTCMFTVTVEVDDDAPVIHGCLAPTILRYVQAGQTSRIVSWPEPTATDGADQNVQLDGPTGDLQNGGMMDAGQTRYVSYVATDDFGNEQMCDFTVQLLVDQAPEYFECTMNTDVTTERGVSYAYVTWPEPRVTDDLSQNDLNLTKSHEPGRNYEMGVYLVKYTATDVIGNVGSCSFVLTVKDEEKPVIGTCPESQVINLRDQMEAAEVTWTNPMATDNSCNARSNCDTVLTVTSDLSPGLYTANTYTVTVTVTDESMNTQTCSFTVTVDPYVPDISRPVYDKCQASFSHSTDPGMPTYTFTWTAPNVTDNLGVVFNSASHPVPSYPFPIGSTTVSYRAEDAAGNEGTCSFVVTVTDNEAPVWATDSVCGTAIIYYVRVGHTDPLMLAVPTPTATDNSGVPPTIANTLPNFDSTAEAYPFAIGTNNIQFTATDRSDNPVGECTVGVNILRDRDPWSIKGSVTLTRIRGIRGQFSDATATVLLSELARDMDTLFRGFFIGSSVESSIRSYFVGVEIMDHTFTNGNTDVTFRLYFSKMRQGRHTSRQIEQEFDRALGSSLVIDTNNVVLANSLEFDVREFKFTSRIVQLDNTFDPPFVSQYDNDESRLYIELENRINAMMDAIFDNFFGYAVSALIDFRDGSIINDVVLVFDDTTGTSESGIAVRFNDVLEADGEYMTSGLYFERVPDASNQEVCPVGECANGGTCTYGETYTNVCTCPDGFSGANCETEDSTIVLSPLAIAAIIAGGVLALLLLFAVCCCFLYFCRDPPKDDRYPRFIDDDASAVSSMDVIMMPRELPPPAPVLALPPPETPLLALPPPEAPTLRLYEDYPMDDGPYGRYNDAFAMDMYPSDAPSFTPDGEVYVTGPNQVAIRPSVKRSSYYRY